MLEKYNLGEPYEEHTKGGKEENLEREEGLTENISLLNLEQWAAEGAANATSSYM